MVLVEYQWQFCLRKSRQSVLMWPAHMSFDLYLIRKTKHTYTLKKHILPYQHHTSKNSATPRLCVQKKHPLQQFPSRLRPLRPEHLRACEPPFLCHQYKPLHLQKNNIMNFPENLKYTKDHEWVKIEGNIGTIGITDFAQRELGDIVYVDIEGIGDHMAKESTFGTVEAVKTVSELFMPVSGKILEMNSGLDGAPESINQDPYGNGWMIKVELSDLSEVDGLMSAAEYSAMVSA